MQPQRLLDQSDASDGEAFQRQLIELAKEMDFGLLLIRSVKQAGNARRPTCVSAAPAVVGEARIRQRCGTVALH